MFLINYSLYYVTCNVLIHITNFSDLDDAKSRSLDNLGRVYARTGDYEDAIQL